MANEIMTLSQILRTETTCTFAIFCIKNKKKEFKVVEKLLPKISKVLDSAEGGLFLGFEATQGQINLLLTILPIVLPFKGTIVFANGEIEPKPWKLMDVLPCFKTSLRIKKREKYCHVPLHSILSKRNRSIEITVKSRLNISPEESNIKASQNPKTIPCRMLSFDVLEGTDEELNFLASKTRCSTCPNLRGFIV